MRLVRCNAEARHYYNADEFSECPECRRLAQGNGADPGADAPKRKTKNGTLSLDDLNKRLATIEKQKRTTTSREPEEEPTSPTPRDEPASQEPESKHSLLQKFFRRKDKTASPAPESQPEQPEEQPVRVPDDSEDQTEPQPTEDSGQELPIEETPEPEQTSLASSVAAVQRTHQSGSGSNKTIAYYNNAGGTDPVVGWLVGVKGVYQGESFNLVTGQNFIGRSLSMHVILRNDQTVSRDNHAVIMFDPQKQIFYLMNGQSSGITYLNGAPVLMPAELHPYDQIAVGDTLLVFVPFCGAQFRWDDYIKKDNAE